VPVENLLQFADAKAAKGCGADPHQEAMRLIGPIIGRHVDVKGLLSELVSPT
jgi:hypothetical protein